MSISALASCDAGSPWPCEKCGEATVIAPRAGRFPCRTAVILMLTLPAVWLVSLLDDGVSPWLGWLVSMQGFGALVGAEIGLCLWVAVGLRRHARQAWQCTACGHCGRARVGREGLSRAVVLVPTYDNGGTIAELLRRILVVERELPVIVINDGATDQTRAEVLRVMATSEGLLTLVEHAQNLGKGAAIITGLQRARAQGYTHAITIDADLQHLPEDLPLLTRAMCEQPLAVICGERDLSGEHVSGGSRFGRRFSNLWLWIQTGQTLGDSQSGFRVYPVAQALSLPTQARSYDYETEVLILAARAGLPLVSVSIRAHYPPAPERVSHFHLWRDNWRITWVNVRCLFGAWLWPLGWPHRFVRDGGREGE